MAPTLEHPAGFIDLLPLAAALVDTEGKLLYCNEAYRQHPSWRGKAAPAVHEANAFLQRTRQQREVCIQVVRSRKAGFHVGPVHDAAGSPRRCRWLCLPLDDGHGAVNNVLFVELDEEAPPYVLSDRELEVFGHLGHGRTTHEIAEAMLISPKTVESYRARIKEKLSIEHNTELVRRAVQWVEGYAAPTTQEAPAGSLSGPLIQEIRSPLAAIAGLAASLAQRAEPAQACQAELILTSTEQLIRRLDLELQRTRRREDCGQLPSC